MEIYFSVVLTSGKAMRGRSRADTKSRRRKPVVPKRASGAEAARRSSSAAGQDSVTERLNRELAEARQQQTATRDVLRIISSSGSLERVFETILGNATRICEAKFGTLFRFDGKNYCPAAQFNTPEALLEAQMKRGSFEPTSGSPFDYVMRAKQVYYRADKRNTQSLSVEILFGHAACSGSMAPVASKRNR
jgi:two-component system NtrC family sensor kinase